MRNWFRNFYWYVALAFLLLKDSVEDVLDRYKSVGYWICDDDWDGISVKGCTFVEKRQPVRGVTVYYRNGLDLKPYFAK